MENSYIGIKLIKAEPMTRGDYNIFRGWQIPENENPGDEGYKVEYIDGYVSWTPKDIFDNSHLKVSNNSKLPSGVSISREMVEGFIKEKTVMKIGEKTTLVKVVLNNGFEIIETSSCVDPANYDEEIGTKICMERVVDKTFEFLGFLLQTAVGGVK